MKLFQNKNVYTPHQFELEFEFEKEIVQNSKLFFGSQSIYIDAKKKIATKSLGNSIPDGYLFDFSEKDKPEFYIVEVELAKHDFYSHIFPQLTKFFGFYKNPKSQNDLVEKIFTFINNDVDLRASFKKYLGEKEIYKFLKDTIEKSQNILLVIDGDKKELPEIMDTYTDTWGKMVKLLMIRKFVNQNEVIYSMHPDFENIEFAEIEEAVPTEVEDMTFTEAYHLEGVSALVQQIYTEIKSDLLSITPSLVFNPKKLYISIRREKNIAFFLIRRKKIVLIVPLSEVTAKDAIAHHHIQTLTATVQKFWYGGSTSSCAIIVDSMDNIAEVKELLGSLVNKYHLENSLLITFLIKENRG